MLGILNSIFGVEKGKLCFNIYFKDGSVRKGTMHYSGPIAKATTKEIEAFARRELEPQLLPNQVVEKIEYTGKILTEPH